MLPACPVGLPGNNSLGFLIPTLELVSSSLFVVVVGGALVVVELVKAVLLLASNKSFSLVYNFSGLVDFLGAPPEFSVGALSGGLEEVMVVRVGLGLLRSGSR